MLDFSADKLTVLFIVHPHTNDRVGLQCTVHDLLSSGEWFNAENDMPPFQRPKLNQTKFEPSLAS